MFLKPSEGKTCNLTAELLLCQGWKERSTCTRPVLSGVLYLLLSALLRQSCVCNSEQPYFAACFIFSLCNFSSSPLSKHKYCWIVRRLLFWERSQREPSLSLFFIWLDIAECWEEGLNLLCFYHWATVVELNRGWNPKAGMHQCQIIKVIIVPTIMKSYHFLRLEGTYLAPQVNLTVTV